MRLRKTCYTQSITLAQSTEAVRSNENTTTVKTSAPAKALNDELAKRYL